MTWCANSQCGQGEVKVLSARERDQCDDPISRRYCLNVSWNFVKHFRQEVCVREKSARLMPCDGRYVRCAPPYSRPRAHCPIETDPWRLSRVLSPLITLFNSTWAVGFNDLGLLTAAETLPERDLVNHFKGEWCEMRRYILDSVRDSITHSPDNIDLQERGRKGRCPRHRKETLYSFFIFADTLENPPNYRMDENENPREWAADGHTLKESLCLTIHNVPLAC